MAAYYFYLNLLISVTLFSRAIGAPDNVTLPKNFKIGFATSAYQIEGGWNASDKGVSVWDWLTHHESELIVDGQNGDVACDSYHRYDEDIALLKDLQVDFYRLSISWTRILPEGLPNKISEDGVRYYTNILNKLLKNGIEPFVTIYHWDHPEILERMGGWLNDLMVDWFADYARIVFEEFGSKVKFFTTINEPQVLCNGGYATLLSESGTNLYRWSNYTCMHNVLKAHAKTYHMYRDEYRAKQRKGYVGINIPCTTPLAKDPNDKEVEDIDFQFNCGWAAHPIFSKTGDYPEIMKTRVAENSKLQGLPRSRLPTFSKDWVEYIKGSADFFALNHYTSRLVEQVPKKPGQLWYEDSGVKRTVDPKWELATPSDWLYVVPEGFRHLLNLIKSEYNNPPLYVTESGFVDSGGLVDEKRINYFYSYLQSMLDAIRVDGCYVKGYMAWSFMDNFEWISGYTQKFGSIQIDFNNPNRTRTPKQSYGWWKDLIKTRKLVPYNATVAKM